MFDLFMWKIAVNPNHIFEKYFFILLRRQIKPCPICLWSVTKAINLTSDGVFFYPYIWLGGEGGVNLSRPPFNFLNLWKQKKKDCVDNKLLIPGTQHFPKGCDSKILSWGLVITKVRKHTGVFRKIRRDGEKTFLVAVQNNFRGKI